MTPKVNPPLPGKRLNLADADVARIKSELYHGRRQTEIAEIVGCSQGSISRISRGEIYYHIPWPDGSIGPMPFLVKSATRQQRKKIAWSESMGPAARLGSADPETPKPKPVAERPTLAEADCPLCGMPGEIVELTYTEQERSVEAGDNPEGSYGACRRCAMGYGVE